MGPRTSRFKPLGLAVLAPAAERGRWPRGPRDQRMPARRVAFCFPQLLPDAASERSAEASATLLPGLWGGPLHGSGSAPHVPCPSAPGSETTCYLPWLKVSVALP